MDRLSEWKHTLGGYISDPRLLEQASALLAQDELHGLNTRTPEQLALAHQLALILTDKEGGEEDCLT